MNQNRRNGSRYLYFAYGSNLDESQMRYRTPGARLVGRARLADYRLVFRGVADIEPAPGKLVDGKLWSITTNDLRSLDRYEGYPYLYDRRELKVVRADGQVVEAIVYIMVNTSEQSLPSPGYLDGILAGAERSEAARKRINDALWRAGKYLRAEGVTRVRISGKRTHPIDGKPRKPVVVRHRTKVKKSKVRRRARPVLTSVPTATSGMSPASRLEYELDREADLMQQARIEAMNLESAEWLERTTGEPRVVRGRHAERG